MIIFGCFVRQVASNSLQQVCGELAGRECVEDTSLRCFPVLETDHSCRVLLLEITDQVAQWSRLDLALSWDWDRGGGGGQCQEDGVTVAGADSLGDIVKLGLVEAESLGNLEIGFIILILH